jgi:hypothetical protein
MSDLLLRRTARISPCGLYRYRLTREWSDTPLLPFVMLNPSTADADDDDPTIRRCMAFARREGAGGIVVGNQFAFRSTDPEALRTAADPFGPDNERALFEIAEEASVSGMPIVCAWGAHGGHNNHHIVILQRAGARLVCLGMTKDGHPRHPLYVRGDQPLVAFR